MTLVNLENNRLFSFLKSSPRFVGANSSQNQQNSSYQVS